MIPIEGTVYTPMYDFNSKKYIRVEVDNRTRDYARGLQESKARFILNENIDDPLTGNLLTLKVPFRYRRVMCTVEGDTPVQSLAKGDKVKMSVNFNGAWNAGHHSGYAWTIKLIETPSLEHQSPLDPPP